MLKKHPAARFPEDIMKKLLRIFAVTAVLAVLSCVTVNIYFPAEEVRNAADKIVNDVWGERTAPPAVQPETKPETKPDGNKGGRLDWQWGPPSAYAAQNIDVSTPEIRAIKAAMQQRAQQLFPYLDAGNVGIGRNGLLTVRSTEGLDLRSRGEVTRLVNAENTDRQRLYQEIARANGFPDKADEVQAIFAQSWRDKAATGWYVQQPDGSWQKK